MAGSETRPRRTREDFTIDDVRKLHEDDGESPFHIDGWTEEEVADLEWWARDRLLAADDLRAELAIARSVLERLRKEAEEDALLRKRSSRHARRQEDEIEDLQGLLHELAVRASLVSDAAPTLVMAIRDAKNKLGISDEKCVRCGATDCPIPVLVSIPSLDELDKWKADSKTLDALKAALAVLDVGMSRG